MSNEITKTGSLAYSDGVSSPEGLALPTFLGSPSAKQQLHTTQTATTSQAALNLGSLASIGQIAIVNRDSTNFVTLLTGTAGKVVAKLLPGDWAILPAGSDMQAPWIQANTANCVVEYQLTAA